MSKFYFILAAIGIYTIPFLEKNPFNLKNIRVVKEENKTYYIVPQHQLPDLEYEHPTISISIAESNGNAEGGLRWGKNTDRIKDRVIQLREESSMFNQILIHLEKSNYPYAIENKALSNAYGAFSSNKGEMLFQVDKMDDYFFDATIIEEFVHAYQALYYNYTHAKLRSQRRRQAIKRGIDYAAETSAGMINWKKYGNKYAFIESEAKLMTYLIQHQTCSIDMKDIVATDYYNTGGKGRVILKRYFQKRKCIRLRKPQRLGHMSQHFVDIHTFALYQQKFIKHWRKKDGDSIYTKGYYYHRPDALNNVYCPLKFALMPLEAEIKG